MKTRLHSGRSCWSGRYHEVAYPPVEWIRMARGERDEVGDFAKTVISLYSDRTRRQALVRQQIFLFTCAMLFRSHPSYLAGLRDTSIVKRLQMLEISRLAPLLSVLGLVACSSQSIKSDSSDWQERLRQDGLVPRVIVRICVPDTAWQANVSFTSINKDRINSGGLAKIGTTTRGQAVYEHFSDPPDNVKALLVRGSSSGPTYVFLPPGNISSSGWSDWKPPTFQNEEYGFSLKYLYDQTYTKSEVQANAPRMQYMLLSFSEYLARVQRRVAGQSLEAISPC